MYVFGMSSHGVEKSTSMASCVVREADVGGPS
jgi:hypothetical protein